MNTAEFQIMEIAREWAPDAITCDELWHQMRRNNFDLSRQKIAGYLRSMRRRRLFTAEVSGDPGHIFRFYRLTDKALEILDA